ncbi:hypothetical protein EON80_28540 [bacterium]|nr:MAG: hypothetical protein EON80_28540 [bacterium]
MLSAYASDPQARNKASERFGGSEGLLRIAAKAIEPSETGDTGAGPRTAADHEAWTLIRFAESEGLMLDVVTIRNLFERNKLRGGSEHRVALLREHQRVIKDLNVRLTATETLFDYLTDLLLANHLFGDANHLEGFFVDARNLHIITSQPFVEGTHPDWETLKAGLAARGLRHEAPLSKIPNFVLSTKEVGDIHVFDLHEDNVIHGGASDRMEPIDAHFYFDSVSDRIAALQALGLWEAGD